MNRCGASPTSDFIRRGRRTANTSRSRPKRSTIRRRGWARARCTSSTPPAARRAKPSTATPCSRPGRRPGDRIVYWSNTGGQRDLFTVPAAGGTPCPLTNDAAIDWSPVWSPDGRRIYFSSDRGGAMNLWRIAVDESTGRAARRARAGDHRRAGVRGAAAFSKDGSRLAFRSRVGSINPVAIPFDPGDAAGRRRRSCSTRGTTSASRATCRRTEHRSRTSASASTRKICSSGRGTDRCAG